MNKKIKRVIAMALAIGTFSVISPNTKLDLLTTSAYAAENEEGELESITLYDGDGDTIKFYDSVDYDDRVDEDDVEEGDTYFAKTSSEIVRVDTSGPRNKYVKIFKGTSESSRAKDVNDSITISDGSTTTLVIKVYGEDTSNETLRNSDEDDDEYDLQSTYKIKVKYTGGSSDSDSDSTTDAKKYDDVYLERLSISGHSISLSESEVKYTFDVDEDTDEVSIRATPEDEDYDVTIDDEDVDDDDNYKVDVDLEKGKNIFEIKVEDDDDYRIYTIVINRGKTTTDDTTNNNTSAPTAGTTTNVVSTPSNTIAKAQWVQQWQYNDANGASLKDKWFGKYYLKSDGIMATGWLNINGNVYYFGADGAKKIGWQLVSGKWYYLDSQGIMKTGWIKDTDGRYYYLNTDGTMAYNTTINGYRLGANGAWIN